MPTLASSFALSLTRMPLSAARHAIPGPKGSPPATAILEGFFAALWAALENLPSFLTSSMATAVLMSCLE